MNQLQEKLAAGEFVVTTELTPPKGTDLSDVFAKADALRGLADAVNLTESPRARMAIEPTAVARLLIERGHEPIVQFTARDRNRIALQSDLLGASVLGVRNVLFMAGDPPSIGDHPETKPVFDLTTLQMLEAGRALNQGRDMMGNELKGATRLVLGATANPGASDIQAEAEHVARKIAAGAQFLQTQAVFDPEALIELAKRVELGPVALIAGIIPLKSAKMARWMNENVPGIHVPSALIAEMEAVVGDPEAELRTSMALATRIIDAIRPHCSGVHMMMMGWEAHLPQFLRAAKLRATH